MALERDIRIRLGMGFDRKEKKRNILRNASCNYVYLWRDAVENFHAFVMLWADKSIVLKKLSKTKQKSTKWLADQKQMLVFRTTSTLDRNRIEARLSLCQSDLANGRPFCSILDADGVFFLELRFATA